MASRRTANASGRRPEAQQVFREFAWTMAGALSSRRTKSAGGRPARQGTRA